MSGIDINVINKGARMTATLVNAPVVAANGATATVAVPAAECAPPPQVELGNPERGSNARGIAAMLGCMFCFVASDTIIKIVGRDLAVGQIMFMRGVFATLIMGTIVFATGTHRQIRSVISLPIVQLRTFAEAAATLLFFTGLMRLPFADAAAIGQVTPLAVTAGAALFLNEPVGWRRWLATLVGFVGVLIIIKPGTSAFNWAALFIVACVFFVVVRDLTTRLISNAAPAAVLVFLSVAAVTVAGIVMKPFEIWHAPTLGQVAGLALSAVGVSAGYYGAIIAMRSGEISVVSPFRYVVMLYAMFWSFFIFGEIPDRTTWLGVSIVIAAGLYTVYREHVRRRDVASVVGVTAAQL
jgi:drug/metabolite transporter (DMT)-like permease